MSDLEILLRGVAAGTALAIAAAMLRGEQDRAARWTCAVFCLSVAAFAVHSGGAESRALGPFLWIASLLSAAGTGYFWLFAVTLFGERRFSWSRLAPIALLTAVAAIGWSLPRPTANGVWVVHNVLELALVAHVFVVIAGSWRGDLVESRRSLRGPFIAAVALYAVVLSGFEIAEALGTAPAWAGIAQAATLAAMSLGGAFVLLGARRALFELPARAREPEAVDPRDRLLLAKLEHETRVERIWRREGLTIGALATAVGVPEHRLRRLINDGLGHRNFSDFLNAHRIAAAKQELSDPLRAERSVSEIAFALGYASLGPFNRAFKEMTGTTPSAWRAQALGGASPNPEKPD
jgi:AraC-like DNA-binding protein